MVDSEALTALIEFVESSYPNGIPRNLINQALKQNSTEPLEVAIKNQRSESYHIAFVYPPLSKLEAELIDKISVGGLKRELEKVVCLEVSDPQDVLDQLKVLCDSNSIAFIFSEELKQASQSVFPDHGDWVSAEGFTYRYVPALREIANSAQIKRKFWKVLQQAMKIESSLDD